MYTGKIAALWLNTDDASTAFTTEATTANNTNLRYTITDVDKRYWDDMTTILVYDNGDLITDASTYSIEYCGGVIVFTESMSGHTITVSGNSFVMEQRGGLKDYKVNQTCKTDEFTNFGSSGHEEHMATIDTFEGSADGFWVDNRYDNSLGQKMAIIFYTDAVSDFIRYEGYGILNKIDVTTAIDKIITENIGFKGTGPLYLRSN